MLHKDKLFKIARKVKKELSSTDIDDVAIKLEAVTANQIRFAKNKISISKNWDETTLSVLIDKNERVTAIDIGINAKKEIGEIIPQLMAYMNNAPKKENYAPLPDPKEDYTELNNSDQTLQEQPEKLVDYANTVIDEGKSEDIDYVAGAIKSESTKRVLVTSNDVELSGKGSNVYLDVRASAGEQAKGHSSSASAFIADIDPERTTLKAIEYAKKSRNPKRIDPGEYTTYFIPDAAAGLLTWLGFMASAYSVQMGYSFLQEPGQEIGSEKFTLVDDPHYPRGFASRKFDDEGVPTQENYIVSQGKVNTLLHNRFTAKSFNQETTGNAGWIQPQAWQLKVEPGNTTKEEMITSIDTGLIVGNVTYLRFQNPMKGTLSAIVRDGVYLVENGEIQHAVKGLRLSDRFPRILSNIQSIEDEPCQIMHWWLQVPVITGSILAEDVRYTRPVK